jgi:hypothetical protein
MLGGAKPYPIGTRPGAGIRGHDALTASTRLTRFPGHPLAIADAPEPLATTTRSPPRCDLFLRSSSLETCTSTRKPPETS